MKIACAASLSFGREAFQTLGDVTVLPDRGMTASDIREAELLIVRSTTKVNPALIEGSRVRFVATATIGTDHMDLPYLEKRGICWRYAPGCNANSVSEYITSALLCLAARHRLPLEGRTLGVIGVGNVGSKVVAKAQALGLRVLQNDPPRQEAEFPSARPASACPFHPLDELLAESDFITLHVPLLDEGPHPTCRLAGADFFRRMKRGAIFINSARGPVVETAALIEAMTGGVVSRVVIDTWDPEPAYPGDLLERADIGTPHIAGHSLEGKVQGTYINYLDACRFLGRMPAWSPEPALASLERTRIRLPQGETNRESALWEIVRQVYDIEDDDRRLRCGNLADTATRAAHFDELRKNYPVRREFPSALLTGQCAPSMAAPLRALGFILDGAVISDQ